MIDLDELLAPISDESPAGDDLRERSGDDTFERLDALRREVDPEEDPDGEGRESDWQGISRIATSALEEQSKDLELAARLTEAEMHREGFAGLRDGLRLVRALIDNFWEHLHPGLDEGEIVLPIRARPLSWLSTALASGTPGFLPGLTLVEIARSGSQGLRWKDRQDGERLMLADPSRFEEMVASGMMTGEAWSAAIGSVDTESLRVARDVVAECEIETNELEKLCNERFGDEDAPNLIPMRDLLGEIREYLDDRVGDREPAVGAEEGVAGEGGTAAAAVPGLTGPIRSRADAVKRLTEVADYFRQAEPHSPMAALIERAVRWGSMSFEELVRDYIKDPTTQGAIWELLGISPPDEYSG